MKPFIYAIRPDLMDGLETIRLPALSERIKRPFQVRSAQGPAGACVLLCSGDGGDCVYTPAAQTWAKSIDADFWVGFWTADRPGEKTLRKTSQLAGHPVPLGDGADWNIPVVRLLDGGSAMPSALVLGENGELYSSELPEYAKLSATVDKLFGDLTIEMGWTEGTPQLTAADRMRLAADALGWNYHLGIDEINALGLLTTQNLSEVMAAILDIPSLKKKITAEAAG